MYVCALCIMCMRACLPACVHACMPMCMCVHVCAHTVWMHAYIFFTSIRHPYCQGYHVGEHEIALSVVWAGVIQNYVLNKTNVLTSVMFCVCVQIYYS